MAQCPYSGLTCMHDESMCITAGSPEAAMPREPPSTHMACCRPGVALGSRTSVSLSPSPCGVKSCAARCRRRDISDSRPSLWQQGTCTLHACMRLALSPYCMKCRKQGVLHTYLVALSVLLWLVPCNAGKRSRFLRCLRHHRFVGERSAKRPAASRQLIAGQPLASRPLCPSGHTRRGDTQLVPAVLPEAASGGSGVREAAGFSRRANRFMINI